MDRNVFDIDSKFEQLQFAAPLVPDFDFSIKCTIFAMEKCHILVALALFHHHPRAERSLSACPPFRLFAFSPFAVCSSIEVRHWLVIFHCSPWQLSAAQPKNHVPMPFAGRHLYDSLDQSGQWVVARAASTASCWHSHVFWFHCKGYGNTIVVVWK